MRRFLCVVAVVGLTAALATPAQAARHSIDATVQIAQLEATGSPPFSGSEEVAGTFEGKPGSGAIVGTNFFPVVPTFNGTFRVYFKKGTVKGNLEGTGAPTPPPNPNLSFDLTGSGEITKGSGKYKGAHGKFTFTGLRPTERTVATLVVTGWAKY